MEGGGRSDGGGCGGDTNGDGDVHVNGQCLGHERDEK